MPTETTPATSTSGSTTPLCGHCGRPVINTPAVVYGGVAYHTECTRSPYAADEIERLRAERDGCSIMPDIVERLRALSRHEHDDISVGDEAADIIEVHRNSIDALIAGWNKDRAERDEAIAAARHLKNLVTSPLTEEDKEWARETMSDTNLARMPRDLATILRTEARNQRTPPIDYAVAEDGGRMVARPEPDIAMAELLEEAAARIAELEAALERAAKIADAVHDENSDPYAKASAASVALRIRALGKESGS